MLHHETRGLRAKTNANHVNGYPPGTLLCVGTGAGGGFVPSPEQLTVWVKMGGWPMDLFPRTEFPQEVKDRYSYGVWQEDGSFYLEEHRRKYGWSLPVTEEQKRETR